MADGTEAAIDAREIAPAAAHRDMYIDSLGNVIPDLSLIGPLAAGVPGSVDGLLTALDHYGTMPLKSVINPAIQLAAEGFPLHSRLARHFVLFKSRFSKYPSTAAAYSFEGGEYRAGDIWRQPELAQTLSLIRDQGRDGFYRGETAARIVQAMHNDGGIITAADLASYNSIIRKPLRGKFRGYDILSMPPSSSGGVALLQMLSMLEHDTLTFPGGGDANTMHLVIECMRRAFADRAAYLGDPAYHDIPLRKLLSRSYIDSLRESVSAQEATASGDILRGILPPREGTETTHYSIIDRWGNAVSVTTTINSSFGSRYVVPGTGFLLNNEMDDFSIEPGIPNQFGLLGGEANSIQPGKRMLSSMTPTIVLKDDNVFLVTGSPGGAQIITTVLQSILHVINDGMRIDRAVAFPRIHHQWYPDIVEYEDGALHENTRDALSNMGHALHRHAPFGRCDALFMDPRTHTIHGCSDPRGYGSAQAAHEN
jgi:gamma-glutamyltranspeptidase/glutathione hydrolase